MSVTSNSNCLQRMKLRCQSLRTSTGDSDGVSNRQSKIFGFSQEAYSCAEIDVMGSGGTSGEIAEGVIMKGIGLVRLFDGDVVSASNLNRQKFRNRDLGKNKAYQLARNLQPAGHLGTEIEAFPYYYEEAIEKGYRPNGDALICAVDNDSSRVFAAQLGIRKKIPVLFVAVSRDANQGYVFVQEAGRACFGCAFPEAIEDQVKPCPGTPAIVDILKVVAGLALYALDSLLTERRRNWNYRMLYLAGYLNDVVKTIQRNPNCPLCVEKVMQSNGMDRETCN